MDEADIRGATYAQMMAHAAESPRLWGAAVSHRDRCLAILRLRLFRLIEDPSMNRRKLRAGIDAIVEDIKKNGC